MAGTVRLGWCGLVRFGLIFNKNIKINLYKLR